MQSNEHFNIDISPLSSIGIHLGGKGGGGAGNEAKAFAYSLASYSEFQIGFVTYPVYSYPQPLPPQ